MFSSLEALFPILSDTEFEFFMGSSQRGVVLLRDLTKNTRTQLFASLVASRRSFVVLNRSYGGSTSFNGLPLSLSHVYNIYVVDDDER